MSDLRIFRVSGQSVSPLAAQTLALEKSLQTLIENNLEEVLGVRFLATEYSTGAKHGGRIDTLGLDENNCPVIIEYKRAVSENVINQGLFYLDWLLDHKAEFRWLVMERYDKEVAEAIEWSGTRLLCIAGDFKKYDLHAIQQIPRNIELYRFGYYGEDVLVLDLVGGSRQPGNAHSAAADDATAQPTKTQWKYDAPSLQLQKGPPPLSDLFESLKALALSLGDDIELRELKLYFAFRRIRNFACVEVRPQAATLVVYLRLDPASVAFEEGFSRDVSQIGHWGTGNVELSVRNAADLEKLQPLLLKSYENS